MYRNVISYMIWSAYLRETSIGNAKRVLRNSRGVVYNSSDCLGAQVRVYIAPETSPLQWVAVVRRGLIRDCLYSPRGRIRMSIRGEWVIPKTTC